MIGEPENAVYERKSLDIQTRLGQTRARGITELNLGVQAYADGRWREAEELYNGALGDLLHAGDRQTAAHVGSSLAELLISRGELDEAEALLVKSRRVLRSSTFAAFAVFAEIQLARCALERDDAASAVVVLERITKEENAMGQTALILEAGAYLARAHAHSGSPAIGLAVLDEAVSAAGEEAALYVAAIERERAGCLRELGRIDDARAALERSLHAAERQGMLYEQFLARRARIELKQPSVPSAEELRELERITQLLGLDG
jgi:ATP/maltotriose-dependent transcriptional regulator MalT